MRHIRKDKPLLTGILIILTVVTSVSAQSKTTGRTLFFDSDGNPISNNEFVDIRMANYHIPDRTLMRTLADGTVEFRLQKVPQEGAVAPVIEGPSLEGETLSAAGLKGKVIVLNFWFIGCPSCSYEMPKLNAVAAKFSEHSDVVFIAVAPDPARAVKKYLSANEFSYRMIADGKPLLKTFGFGGYPKNIVIDKRGRIVYWRSTIRAWDKFESVIRTELNKPAE
ncbi:MAG: TlpA disulfide reductase family protein [Acidobacteriota bacterium]